KSPLEMCVTSRLVTLPLAEVASHVWGRQCAVATAARECIVPGHASAGRALACGPLGSINGRADGLLLLHPSRGWRLTRRLLAALSVDTRIGARPKYTGLPDGHATNRACGLP